MISAVLVYATIANVIERPDGVKIAACFIAGIIVVSLLSRVVRAFELRVTAVHQDETAERFIRELAPGPIKIIANEPNERDEAQYRDKFARVAADHHIPDPHRILFLEVTITDPSDFETELRVTGEEAHGYRVLRVASPSIPTPSPRCCYTSRKSPDRHHMSTSTGLRATRSSTCSGICSSGMARWHRSPVRSCARPNPIPNADPSSTLASSNSRGVRVPRGA